MRPISTVTIKTKMRTNFNLSLFKSHVSYIKTEKEWKCQIEKIDGHQYFEIFLSCD